MPSTCIVTNAFVSQAEYQAQMLGLDKPPVTYVLHPISNMSPSELKSKAEASFSDARASIEMGPQQLPTWASGAAQGCSS